MKKIVLLIIIAFNGMISICQDKPEMIDTIYVDSKAKTYVYTGEYVKWVDVGIPDDYLKETDGETVFFMARTDSLPPALLVIQYGDKIYHGTIAVKKNMQIEDRMVNFMSMQEAQPSLMVNEDRVREDKTKNIEKQLIDRRIALLEGNSNFEETTFGLRDGKITFSLTIGRQDAEHYFLKLGVFNKGKEDLDIDIVDLYYKDVDPSSNLPISRYERPVAKHFSQKNEMGEPYGPAKANAFLFYVIKKYKLSKKGYLEVSLREKNSSRVLSFEIASDQLNNFKSF